MSHEPQLSEDMLADLDNPADELVPVILGIATGATTDGQPQFAVTAHGATTTTLLKVQQLLEASSDFNVGATRALVESILLRHVADPGLVTEISAELVEKVFVA